MINSTLKLSQLAHFASTNVNKNGQGVIFTALAGQTTNGDYKLVDDCFITGGILSTLTSTFGDSTTFQVIDIDNIMGYGANVVLGQYITNWYMRSDTQLQIDESIPYPAKIYTGLYLRVRYTSIGATDVQVIVNYRLHKALY